MVMTEVDGAVEALEERRQALAELRLRAHDPKVTAKQLADAEAAVRLAEARVEAIKHQSEVEAVKARQTRLEALRAAAGEPLAQRVARMVDLTDRARGMLAELLAEADAYRVDVVGLMREAGQLGPLPDDVEVDRTSLTVGTTRHTSAEHGPALAFEALLGALRAVGAVPKKQASTLAHLAGETSSFERRPGGGGRSYVTYRRSEQLARRVGLTND